MPLERARSSELAPELPDEGETIFVIGNPLKLEGSVSDGIVSAVREVPNSYRIIQITAPISHGNSGSPVFNLRGQVLGVVQSKSPTAKTSTWRSRPRAWANCAPENCNHFPNSPQRAKATSLNPRIATVWTHCGWETTTALSATLKTPSTKTRNERTRGCRWATAK